MSDIVSVKQSHLCGRAARPESGRGQRTRSFVPPWILLLGEASYPETISLSVSLSHSLFTMLCSVEMGSGVCSGKRTEEQVGAKS